MMMGLKLMINAMIIARRYMLGIPFKAELSTTLVSAFASPIKRQSTHATVSQQVMSVRLSRGTLRTAIQMESRLGRPVKHIAKRNLLLTTTQKSWALLPQMVPSDAVFVVMALVTRPPTMNATVHPISSQVILICVLAEKRYQSAVWKVRIHCSLAW